MIAGGIDVGIKYTKVVIFRDDKIIAKQCGVSGGAKREENVREIWELALKEAQIANEDVDTIGITGKGKYNVPFEGIRKTELMCMTKAAKYLCPEATMVSNIGADEILVAVMKEDGTIGEYFQNQKCSAGLGLMIENLAYEFGWNQEKAASVGLNTDIKVSDGCMVFARMDVLEHMNKGADKASVMSAVIHAAAVRANMTINDITFPNEEKFLLLGGLTLNKTFVDAMERKSGRSFVKTPYAQYGCAIGAALHGMEA